MYIKGEHQQSEKHPTEWEKISASHIYRMDSYLRNKEFLQFNYKNLKELKFLKVVKCLNSPFFNDDMETDIMHIKSCGGRVKMAEA